MDSEEKELIKEISKKYKLKPEYFEQLIKIEKEYANKNMSRRRGIYKDINEQIDKWLKHN